MSAYQLMDNGQSKSYMTLKTLDVLKDWRQFTIIPDASELRKHRNSCYKILKLENIQKEEDKTCIGEISDVKEGRGQMRFPGTDKVDI